MHNTHNNATPIFYIRSGSRNNTSELVGHYTHLAMEETQTAAK